LKSLLLLAVLVLLVVGLARPLPVHAITTMDVSPSSVSTGGSVSITLTHILGLPDLFTDITVTDPLGNVFTFNDHSVAVGSSRTIEFPDSTTWTFTSGPGGNTGTDISGTYNVAGMYLSAVLGHFVVLNDHSQFSVPEFGQPLIAVAALILPLLLLARKRNLGRTA
jgi:hypothetical protein